MTYQYELDQKSKKKYGFTHLLVNGWFGKYDDKFNQKLNGNTRIGIILSSKDIDKITDNAISYKEY
jgi:hypothetical protein